MKKEAARREEAEARWLKFMVSSSLGMTRSAAVETCAAGGRRTHLGLEYRERQLVECIRLNHPTGGASPATLNRDGL